MYKNCETSYHLPPNVIKFILSSFNSACPHGKPSAVGQPTRPTQPFGVDK